MPIALPDPLLMAQIAALGGAAAAGVGLARRLDGLALPIWAEAAGFGIAAAIVCLGGATLTPGALGWGVALVAILAALAAIDAATREVPDALSLLLIFLGIARLVLSDQPVLALAAVAGGLVALGLVIDRFVPDAAVGAGDLLLGAVAVVWIGFAPLLDVMIVMAILLWAHLIAAFALRLGAVIANGGARHSPVAGMAGVPMAPAFGIALAAVWIGRGGLW